MKKYRYKILSTGYSSVHYGPCDVCKKHASEVYHLVEEQQYVRPDGKVSYTRYNCLDLFGHKECLLNKVKQPCEVIER